MRTQAELDFDWGVRGWHQAGHRALVRRAELSERLYAEIGHPDEERLGVVRAIRQKLAAWDTAERAEVSPR